MARYVLYTKGGLSDVDSFLQPLSTLSHVEDIWFENKRKCSQTVFNDQCFQFYLLIMLQKSWSSRLLFTCKLSHSLLKICCHFFL
jgi:hypothetical protein